MRVVFPDPKKPVIIVRGIGAIVAERPLYDLSISNWTINQKQMEAREKERSQQSHHSYARLSLGENISACKSDRSGKRE